MACIQGTPCIYCMDAVRDIQHGMHAMKHIRCPLPSPKPHPHLPQAHSQRMLRRIGLRSACICLRESSRP
eukprot:362814-Chlamydomonas_euryale.AAC.12